MGRMVYILSRRYRHCVLENLGTSGIAPGKPELRRLARANAAEIGKGVTELAWALYRPLDQVAAQVRERVGWEAI